MPVGDQVSDSARLEGYTWDNPAPIGTSSQNGGSFSSLYVMSGLLGVSLAVTLAPSLVDAMADSPFVLGTTTGTLSLKAYNATQVQVSAISGATRYITLAGSVAGNPVIGTSAGGLEIAPGGANAAAFTYVAGTTSWITFQGSSTGHNYIQSGGVTSNLHINPTGNIMLEPGGAGGWGYITVGGAVGLTFFYGSTHTYFGANEASSVTIIVAGAAEQMRVGNTGVVTLGGGAATPAVLVTPVASQARWVTLTGATSSTNPNIGTSAASLEIKPAALLAAVFTSVASTARNLVLTSATSTTNPSIGVSAGTLALTSGALVTSATLGLGYGTGAGGAVTQITSRTTGVTLSKNTGAITLVSAAGSATPASFTVTNTLVAATDTIVVNQKSGTDKYVILVTNVAAGSFQITSYTTGGTTTEQPVFSVSVIKAVAA